MKQDLEEQLLKDRLASLPKQLTDYIGSAELERKLDLVSKKYNLNSRQETILGNEVTIILLVLDSIDHLDTNLQNGLGVTPETAISLMHDVSDYIFKRVSSYLANTQEDLTVEPEPVSQKNIAPAEAPLPSRDEMLQHIEKPFKTIIKKYVIEYDHQPMKDTSHLIEDKADDILKLEEHYKD